MYAGASIEQIEDMLKYNKEKLKNANNDFDKFYYNLRVNDLEETLKKIKKKGE